MLFVFWLPLWTDVSPVLEILILCWTKMCFLLCCTSIADGDLAAPTSCLTCTQCFAECQKVCSTTFGTYLRILLVMCQACTDRLLLTI